MEIFKEFMEIFEDFADQKEFEMWAFGYSPVSYQMSDLLAWNSHHGDLLWLRASGTICADIKKMISMYRDMKNGEI